jgi:GNAT superfamily N-acetyltransferase
MERRGLRPGEGVITVRFAVPGDLDAVVKLCIEHAAYEKASIHCRMLTNRLHRFLFAPDPRAWCGVADDRGHLVGYATWSREFSTWHAAEYVHMDCLYVRSESRNGGVGALLLQFVGDAAAMMGCSFVEWQTPDWNLDAIRFYDRSGAVRSQKTRYRWNVTNLRTDVRATPTVA